MRLSASFGQIEEVEQGVPGWDLDGFVFTDRERQFHAQIDGLLHEDFFLLRARFNRHIFQRGHTPDGFRSFGFLGVGSSTSRFQRYDFGHRVAKFENNHFQASSEPDFSGIILGFSEEFFAERCRLGRVPDVLIEPSEGVLAANPPQLESLKVRVESILAADEVEGLADSLLEDLAATARPLPTDLSTLPSTQARLRSLGRALDFIDRNIHRALTMNEICRESAASERTLEYAFKEYSRVSPKLYLNSRRLHALRRALLAETGGAGVAEVASRFDYWHMGKLAGDYRAIFSELPSETLKRAKRERAPSAFRAVS